MVTIELSTVLFYRGDAPREVFLRDCAIPMVDAPSQVFPALYGTQGKQDGFVEARAHALAHGLGFTVIDLLVNLEAQNALVMKPDELGAFDFLNFSRVSRALASDASKQLIKGGGDLAKEQLAALRTEPLRTVISRWPRLIDRLVQLEGWDHLKVVAFQAPMFVGSRPISFGSIPWRHWRAIREASCRLDPNIHVRLEAPRSR